MYEVTICYLDRKHKLLPRNDINNLLPRISNTIAAYGCYIRPFLLTISTDPDPGLRPGSLLVMAPTFVTVLRTSVGFCCSPFYAKPPALHGPLRGNSAHCVGSLWQNGICNQSKRQMKTQNKEHHKLNVILKVKPTY